MIVGVQFILANIEGFYLGYSYSLSWLISKDTMLTLVFTIVGIKIHYITTYYSLATV